MASVSARGERRKCFVKAYITVAICQGKIEIGDVAVIGRVGQVHIKPRTGNMKVNIFGAVFENDSRRIRKCLYAVFGKSELAAI